MLDQPEVLCQTMATALRQLHNLQPVHFPTNSLLKNYIQLAEENYQKGLFYEKALLPQFQIRSREEAYHLIQKLGHLLTEEVFIHGDACLPNFIFTDASHFSCFIDVGLSGFSDRHIDLYWAIWSLNYNLGNPKYGDLFLDYYGRENINSEKLRLIAAFEAFG
ncbi:Aminoglycoside 3'-phosphotransferase [Streptococcus intermedius]|nr:Aminoglycoside 3'-phosphotransferase [Streptococcus intermedius]RSJ16485.1 Aminoglycoside 3'-phosphotransferase [Streptococcus intermedius]RSJ31896.1 Aminoglycoside 3'-phosphotransferase [Streptococcus intermedius]